jgi:hypothetical protein
MMTAIQSKVYSYLLNSQLLYCCYTCTSRGTTELPPLKMKKEGRPGKHSNRCQASAADNSVRVHDSHTRNDGAMLQ